MPNGSTLNYYNRKMMKKLLLVAGWMMALCGFAQTTPAPDSEGMTLGALDWTKEVVMGWNLGNSLECPKNETEWGNPKTTKQMILAVKEAGFNAVRIPVRWINHVADQTTMAVDADWMERVAEVVNWCLEEDMFVIINTHHEEWLDRNPYYNKQTENNRKLAALWTNIATYFRDYSEKLVFAGTNETTVNWSAPNTEQQAVQNSYNQTFVDAVRATGGKNYYRNLVVQTFACSPYHGLSGFTIPNDPVEGRLSVEFHYYDPYEYCGSCQYYYWGSAYKDKGPVPSSDERTMSNLFDRVRNAWAAKGLGIVIGEYGVSNHYQQSDKQTQMENMQYYLKCLVGYARERGFAAFVWDNNAFNNGTENFGIFKRWSNMAVGNEYFLKGITEGAGKEYKEPEPKQDDDDYGQGGTMVWEGDALLDWGNGLQLNIPSSLFEGKDNTVQLVLYYTQDFTDYDDLQLFYGDWSKMVPYKVGDMECNGDFSPSSYYGTGSGDSHITPISFDDATLSVIREKGLVLQGHGVRLTKVVVVEASGVNTPVVNEMQPAGNTYTLDGRVVKTTVPGQVYIRSGRKFVVK